MSKATFNLSRRAAVVAGFSLFVVPLSLAQTGYAVGDSANPGPVRMARISYVKSGVEYRPASSVGWSTATINTPIRQGAEIWAENSSRAETVFDDGSVLRLGNGGVASLETMYSDSNGEFTELKVTNGLATVHIKSKLSEFQVDTPQASVKAYGPATIRVGINGNICEIADQSGQAEIQSGSGTQTLSKGQMIDYRSPSGSTPTAVAGVGAVRNVPAADNWDNWSSQRDTVVYHQDRYVPQDVDLMAGDLDQSGTWHDDPKYGHVWCPTEAANWQPYQDGSWAWVAPFGYTWVGSEPWGWAPYHYGTWYHASYGWGWCPGPADQYWAPAVVDYCDDGTDIAWAPLAPWEVQYPPAFSIGFASGDWALSFSIGQAGCYFPGGGDYCVGRPWANSFANSGWNYYDPGRLSGYYANISYNNSDFGRSRFQPYYGSHGGGVFASHNAFASGGHFGRVGASQAGIFQRGRSYTGAPNGAQVFGPPSMRPSTAAFTPSHHFSHNAPSAAIAQRAVYRGAVGSRIAQQSSNPGRVLTPSNRVAANRAAGNAARTGAANNRVAANNNKFNRFNNVSKSPFGRQTSNTRNGMAVAHNENTAASRNGKNAMAAAHQGIGVAHNRNVAATHNANVAARTRNAVAAAAHNRNANGPKGRANAHGGNVVASAAHNRNATSQNRVAANRNRNAVASTTRNRNAATQNRVAATRRASNPVRSAPRRVASTTRMNRATSHTTSTMRRAPRTNAAPRSTFGGFNRAASRPAPMQRSAPRAAPRGGFGGGGGFSRPAPRQSAPRGGGFGGGGSRPAPRPSAPRGGGGGNRRHP